MRPIKVSRQNSVLRCLAAFFLRIAFTAGNSPKIKYLAALTFVRSVRNNDVIKEFGTWRHQLRKSDGSASKGMDFTIIYDGTEEMARQSYVSPRRARETRRVGRHSGVGARVQTRRGRRDPLDGHVAQRRRSRNRTRGARTQRARGTAWTNASGRQRFDGDLGGYTDSSIRCKTGMR